MIMIIGIIITAAVILAASIYFALAYSKLVKIQKEAEEFQKSIEENLKKRYEIIPKLVGKSRNHIIQEDEKLDDIVEAGNRVVSAVGVEEMAITEKNLYESVDDLFDLEIKNKNLKEDRDFIETKEEYLKIEENLLNSRKNYNKCVKEFNSVTDSFPGNLIARLLKFKRKERCRVNGYNKK